MIIHTRPAAIRGMLAVTAGAVLALTAACDKAGPTATATATAAPPAAASQAAPSPDVTASPASAGNLPDVCTLLSNAEVTSLTGHTIAQMDADGAAADAATRYCQWQLDGRRLAVFLAHTSAAEFAEQGKPWTAVAGVADAAFIDSGHLYALHGAVQIDVYVSGGSDDENLSVAKTTVAALLPKL